MRQAGTFLLAVNIRLLHFFQEEPPCTGPFVRGQQLSSLVPALFFPLWPHRFTGTGKHGVLTILSDFTDRGSSNRRIDMCACIFWRVSGGMAAPFAWLGVMRKARAERR